VPASERQRVLVTGATGYVGGRLIPRLLARGYRVRVLVRDPDRLAGRSWREQVEVAVGDVLDPATLPAALDGVEAAYYLIHSMSSHADFAQRDRRAARTFAKAAAAQGVTSIIYLGGLGQSETGLSEHLRSRQETGVALREAGVPVTEFRASILVGAGSVSFEMIRNLTERLPVMICPRWVYTRTQPIAIDDALAYLLAALETPGSAGQVIEIGGRDVLTYKEMMLTYARLRGLRRFIVPVPVLTPRLSSYWVHLVTPIPSMIAQPLIEGLGTEVVVTDDLAHRLFPQIIPMDYATAVVRALSSLDASDVETSWSDALVSSQGDIPPVILTTQEGMLIEQRQQVVDAPAGVVYAEFAGLGGRKGWLAFNRLWRLRGTLDRLVGGVGFRRGRRHPDDLRVGDAVDFWRVEAVEPGHLLRLRAEMKVPGRAWLQFEAEPLDAARTRLVQTAFFAPRGLFGLVYWYLLYPIHGFIFSRLIRGLAQDAAARAGKVTPPPATFSDQVEALSEPNSAIGIEQVRQWHPDGRTGTTTCTTGTRTAPPTGS
jgi:uncharacterized protein YbjT (DUF2867 family)